MLVGLTTILRGALMAFAVGRSPAAAVAVLHARLSGPQATRDSSVAGPACANRSGGGCSALLPPAECRRGCSTGCSRPPALLRLAGTRCLRPSSAHSSAAVAALAAVEERMETDAAQASFSAASELARPVAETLAATAALERWIAQESQMQQYRAAGSPDPATVSRLWYRKFAVHACVGHAPAHPRRHTARFDRASFTSEQAGGSIARAILPAFLVTIFEG